MVRTLARGPSLVAFDAAHVPAAAGLVAARVRALRAIVPELPAGWTEVDQLERLIGELALRGSGVAAVQDGNLVGFQAATLIDGHGGSWAYTPDIGHAVAGDRPGRLVEAMYARLAEAWARVACLEHVVTVLVDDAPTRDTLARVGFGQSVIDLVRDLSPVHGTWSVGDAVVRRATPADAAAILEHDQGLRRHLAASPVFLRMGPARSLELHRHLLADPGIATFLAEQDGRPLAFLRIGPSATDVATVVRDPRTASITGAFTVADRRGDGIASCLLDAAVAWARDAGYARVAVDHESANGEAARFWARHCTPVTISMARRLRPGVAP
jgi:GNAT superfamily N-acetyltransferase